MALEKIVGGLRAVALTFDVYLRDDSTIMPDGTAMQELSFGTAFCLVSTFPLSYVGAFPCRSYRYFPNFALLRAV